MNLPPPMGRSAAAYTPPLLNPSDPATAKALAQAAEHGRAAIKMTEAVASVMGYAAEYADYRAPHCAGPVDADGRYDLNSFMTDAYGVARRLASRTLGPAAQVRLVVPMWVHTVQQAITEDVITIPTSGPYGDIWCAVALAAADRAPSVVLASWDWCGTFTCDTPDAEESYSGTSKACSSTYDDSEATA